MPSHTLRSLRVLIVDDDPLIRTTFAEQLDSQRAITVVAAASGGRQAISLLMTGQQPVDVVLLDSDMPDMDGAQTARAIYERFPRMPIVMLSSLVMKPLTPSARASVSISSRLKTVNMTMGILGKRS